MTCAGLWFVDWKCFGYLGPRSVPRVRSFTILPISPSVGACQEGERRLELCVTEDKDEGDVLGPGADPGNVPDDEHKRT